MPVAAREVNDGAVGQALRLRAGADRRHARGRAEALRHRPLPAVRQAGEPEPRRLDQGPHRALDDRRRGALRPPGAGRHHRRGDRRQHRPRPGAGGHPQGLSDHPGRPRQDVAREDPAPARPRRRGPAHPLGRRQGTSGILSGHGGGHRRGSSRRLLRQPVRQSRQPDRPRDDHRAGALVAARGADRRGRRRRRLRRHADRPRPLLRQGLARHRDGARRPGRVGARAAGQDRQDGTGRQLDRRGHRRGLRASQRRPFPGQEGLLDPRQAEHARRARPALARRHPRRLLVWHLARRRAALLPRAEGREARRHLRLRQRQQVPLQGVQRLLAGRAGPVRGGRARRPSRPRRAARIAKAARSSSARTTPCSRPMAACAAAIFRSFR